MQSKYPYILAAEQFACRFTVIDPNVPPTSPEAVVWSWSPMNNWDIQDADLRAFGNPSEVKSVLNNTHLLATASGGACVLIDFKTNTVKHMLHADGNTHSAELLADGNIVTASSSGCYLRLFDLKNDPEGKTFREYYQRTAHGVVFDYRSEKLFSCGGDGMAAWEYDPEKVELKQVEDYNWNTPEHQFDGHDLSLDSSNGKLVVTGHSALWYFDTLSGKREMIAPLSDVKSASFAPELPPLLMIPDESWWSDRLLLLNTDKTHKDLLRMAHWRFYKARWLTGHVEFGKIN